MRFRLPLAEFGAPSDYEFRSRLDHCAVFMAYAKADLVVWQAENSGFQEVLRSPNGGDPQSFDPAGEFLLSRDLWGINHIWRLHWRDLPCEAAALLTRTGLTAAEWTYFLGSKPYRDNNLPGKKAIEGLLLVRMME